MNEETMQPAEEEMVEQPASVQPLTEDEMKMLATYFKVPVEQLGEFIRTKLVQEQQPATTETEQDQARAMFPSLQ